MGQQVTRQGWAERKVGTAYTKLVTTYPIKPWTHYAAQTLLAEHKRAVRVVKKQLAMAQRTRAEASQNKAHRSVLEYWGGQEDACANILAALQRGRE